MPARRRWAGWDEENDAGIRVFGSGFSYDTSGTLITGSIDRIHLIEHTGTTSEITNTNWVASQFIAAVQAAEIENFNPLGTLLGTTLTIDAADSPWHIDMGEFLVWDTPFWTTIFDHMDSLTYHGTSHGDFAHGTEGDDRYYGGIGNDQLHSYEGNDVMFGGAGSDLLTSREGNDLLSGEAGADTLNAGAGDDTLIGGFGGDLLTGNDGHDALSGGALGDVLFGGAGEDFINGGWGHDRLNGGDDADGFFHIGIFNHGSDWIQDYDAAEDDVLQFGNNSATRGQFQINTTHTSNADGERSGDNDIEEAFVIYRPTGQILWALVDGAAQDGISLQIGTETFDLYI